MHAAIVAWFARCMHAAIVTDFAGAVHTMIVAWLRVGAAASRGGCGTAGVSGALTTAATVTAAVAMAAASTATTIAAASTAAMSTAVPTATPAFFRLNTGNSRQTVWNHYGRRRQNCADGHCEHELFNVHVVLRLVVWGGNVNVRCCD
jgi:hypothetical protein